MNEIFFQCQIQVRKLYHLLIGFFICYHFSLRWSYEFKKRDTYLYTIQPGYIRRRTLLLIKENIAAEVHFQGNRQTLTQSQNTARAQWSKINKLVWKFSYFRLFLKNKFWQFSENDIFLKDIFHVLKVS